MKKICLLFGLSAMFWGSELSAQLFRRPLKKDASFPTTQTPSKVQQKKAETWWYYAVFDNQTAEENVKVADISYNAEGKISEWRVYNMEGKLNYTYVYEYDRAKLQAKRSIKMPSGETVLDFIETFNGQSQLAEKQRFNEQGDLIEITLTEYNSLGQLMKTTRLDANKVPQYEAMYEYIDAPKAILETRTNLLTKEVLNITTTLNADGQPLEETAYKGTGELLHKTAYSYDNQKRLLEKKFYKNGKQVDVLETYLYSTVSNEVTHSTFTEGGKELSEYVIYKYEF